MSEYERTILVTSYHRAIAGGPVIAQVVAGSVHGLKAVLIAQRDEMAGAAPAGTLAAKDGLPAPGTIAATVAVAAGEPTAPMVAAAEDPPLPSFMGAAGANGSLAADCDRISRTTGANGGLVTAEGMRDADFALGEQFCLARTFAITQSDALTARTRGSAPTRSPGNVRLSGRC
jgi:hypothetical protein